MSHVSFFGKKMAFQEPCVGNGFGIRFVDGSWDSNLYPIIAPYLTCIDWYWKFKTWNLATDFSYTPPASSPVSLVSGVLPTSFTDEKDLLTAFGLAFAKGSGANFIVFTLFNGEGGPGSPSVKFVDPNYSPAIRIFGTIGALDFDSRPDIFTPDGSMTGSIAGISIPIYYINTGAGLGGTFNATQFDLTLDSLWPYT